MLGRRPVAEGIPQAQLLKAPQIMKQAAEPCQLDVFLVHTLAPRDLLAQVRDAIRVGDLEGDALVGSIVGVHICQKRRASSFSIDANHSHSPAFDTRMSRAGTPRGAAGADTPLLPLVVDGFLPY